MLTLGGIDYGSIGVAPGALGFFGEGYPYHRRFKRLGMNWDGMFFVSKTVTWEPRPGNMPLRADNVTPQERFIPRSIVVKPWSGHTLNAVGLSNPGADWCIHTWRWQRRTSPFMISFMSVAETSADRLEETKQFAKLMCSHRDQFMAPFAIQANRACPNAGHLPEEYFDETGQMLDLLGMVGVPVVVNFNPVVPTKVLVETAAHSKCDGLWIANTVPWGDPAIDWRRIFGTTESPLAKRGLPAGGLSGPDCLPLTIRKVQEAREAGITKPIVGGNGVQSANGFKQVRYAGADAVAIGTVGMVRPWRMQAIRCEVFMSDLHELLYN